ncbi:hypothetical protein JN00_0156 [Metamycoplasma subdolum]|uniref:Uncharacterized protein n=1 Tax=Metamycoplasma subdolum TaxID=92407 RepID=A0A3M0A9P5_9BACT|nr:hypothetical protein [Metamycoplasma subdolum]RMA79105.1 hypothetical protein JN00_0156 [Metamycoplasma subdolum]WPB50628.1 hypothetical protein R9C05_00500 [Metamycoplasma subdolum]
MENKEKKNKDKAKEIEEKINKLFDKIGVDPQKMNEDEIEGLLNDFKPDALDSIFKEAEEQFMKSIEIVIQSMKQDGWSDEQIRNYYKDLVNNANKVRDLLPPNFVNDERMQQEFADKLFDAVEEILGNKKSKKSSKSFTSEPFKNNPENDEEDSGILN